MAGSNIKTTGMLGTYHMAGNDVYEPQRTNNFEVQLVINEYLERRLKEMGVTDYSEKFTLSVSSTDSPQMSFSPLTVSRGNNTMKYASRPSFSDSSIVCTDFIGLDTEKVLETWMSLVYNKDTQEVGYASEYKQQAYLIEMTTKGDVRNSWLLKGCWPSSYQPGQLDNENNSLRQISLTLTYDWCVLLTD